MFGWPSDAPEEELPGRHGVSAAIGLAAQCPRAAPHQVRPYLIPQVARGLSVRMAGVLRTSVIAVSRTLVARTLTRKSQIVAGLYVGCGKPSPICLSHAPMKASKPRVPVPGTVASRENAPDIRRQPQTSSWRCGSSSRRGIFVCCRRQGYSADPHRRRPQRATELFSLCNEQGENHGHAVPQ